MKRYETMSKEEIMEFFTGCQNRTCDECVKEKRTHHAITQCAKDYLTEEMPEPLMVRRYQNICCKQDLDEAFEHAIQLCSGADCSICKYQNTDCCVTRWFIDYLGELEPERPAEWYKEAKYDKSRKQKA